jgi:hypothetical protein
MKTEEIMKDSTYNNEFNEKDNGYLSNISDENSKPQMNADERRYVNASCFDKRIHRKGREGRKAVQHESLLSCVTKIRYDINNELRRTETNSGYSEFVRVRISSVLSLLFAQAHERA